MLYYLYNDFRENILFDLNSRVRSRAILNHPSITSVKLSEVGSFSNLVDGEVDVLVFPGCCLPCTQHDFPKHLKPFMKNFFELFVARVILFEDIHNYTFCNNLHHDLERWDIRYGVSMYECPEFDEIQKRHNWTKTAVLPHHFDSETFAVIPGTEKKYDILIYGDLGSAYPFRRRLCDLVKKRMKKLRKK